MSQLAAAAENKDMQPHPMSLMAPA